MAALDPDKTYKAAVIGAGSGGLTLAIGLAGFGHEVALIEGRDVGGDCTNVGCVPSKALLHAARSGRDDPFGWTQSRRNDLRDQETSEMAEHEQITLVHGWARLTGDRDPHVVAVDMPDGSVSSIRAEHVVICAGSSPVRFEIDGLPEERLLTNEELFELEAAPRSALFVGGGPISLEMATAFADLGSRTAIVELQDRILPSEDLAISETLTAALTARGIEVHTGTTVERFDVATDTAELSNGTQIGDVELVVLAVGRAPKLERLDLEAAGVEVAPQGIVADDWGRTNVDRIWAVGDVTGNTLTTHGANAIGRRTVQAIALPKLPRVGSPRAMPSAIYSRPEVASVGLSLADIERIPRASRRRYSVDLTDLDRGYTDELDHGIVVVDVERFTGAILRAAIVGPAATELIGIFTMAIDHGIGLRKMFGTIHPYPAYAQAVGKLADEFSRDTLPVLHREFVAMARGRIAVALAGVGVRARRPRTPTCPRLSRGSC